jgi:hypothetical protein
MATMLTVDSARRDEILTDALRRGARVVLTVRRDDGWKTLNSSFVPAPPGAGAITVLAPRFDGPPLELGETVGASFRRGHKKCLFATVVKSPETGTNGRVDRDVVCLRWPDHLQELQRRVYQRVPPPPGQVIPVEFWIGHVEDSAAARPEATPYWSGQIENLSVGGARVWSRSEVRFTEGVPVACWFALSRRAEPLLLNAVFRHCERRGGGFSAGFQFVGLETRTEGPVILAQLAKTVTDFQRATSRHRSRLRPVRTRIG